MLNKNQKILIFVLAFVLGWLWSFGVTHAAEYGLKVSSSITLAGGEQAAIKQVFSVSGADKTNLPAEASVNVIGGDPAGIRATGTDGQKLSARYDQESGSLRVDIPRNRRAATAAWTFSLSYRAEVLKGFGAAQAAQIPAMDSNLKITSQTTTVAADLDMGFATVRSVLPSRTSIGVGQQILTFGFKSQQDKSLLVVFGKQTFVTARFRAELENDSWWWDEVGLTLPPDTNQQRVILESIQPAPSKVRLDRDGNIVAYFNIGPLGSRAVEVTARLAIDNPTYELDLALPVKDVEPTLNDRYDQLTDVWQPLDLDLELSEDAKASEVVKSVFEGVVAKAEEEMTAQEGFSLLPRTSALKMSDWLVGELRHRGVPARVVLGLSMSDGDRLVEKARQHAWVEANVAGVGWITLDPFFGVYSGLYGGADPLRIGLALWGLEDDKPPVDLDLAEIGFETEAAEAPATDGRLAVSATKYMVLPFVAVFNQSVALGPGGIVDDVVLKNRREDLTLGSLAPYQQAIQRSLVFGAASFSDEPVSAQAGGDDSTAAGTISDTSYLVIILEAVLILLYFGWRWWNNRRRRAPKTRLKRSKEALTLHDEALGGSIENEDLVQKVSRPNLPPAFATTSPGQDLTEP